jgi:hypothetical protein
MAHLSGENRNWAVMAASTLSAKLSAKLLSVWSEFFPLTEEKCTLADRGDHAGGWRINVIQ